MQKKIEHFINLVVGLVILNNLYYLSGFLGISYLPIILVCLVISLFFFFINIEKDELVFFLNNWNVVFYLVISIPLSLIDFIINGTTPVFNDLVRVILYATYFAWTFRINCDEVLIKKWLVKISVVSILILGIQGLVENAYPILFSIFLSNNIEKRVLSRIAGTLIDSNSYSGAICTYAFILFYSFQESKAFFKKFLLPILFLFCLYLTDLAGSRQGLLMLIIFISLNGFKKLTIRNFKIIMFSFIVLMLLGVLFYINVNSFIELNPSSSFSRLFFSEDNERSLQSNFDRIHSLLDGFKLFADNNFIYGPGTLNFASRWAQFSSAHEPHNGFLFLIVQFGLLAIVPIYILFVSFKRAFLSERLIFYITFIIHFSFQPNEMYYGNAFLCLFFIDITYYFRNRDLAVSI